MTGRIFISNTYQIISCIQKVLISNTTVEFVISYNHQFTGVMNFVRISLWSTFRLMVFMLVKCCWWMILRAWRTNEQDKQIKIWFSISLNKKDSKVLHVHTWRVVHKSLENMNAGSVEKSNLTQSFYFIYTLAISSELHQTQNQTFLSIVKIYVCSPGKPHTIQVRKWLFAFIQWSWLVKRKNILANSV